jgi:hypothetical protein
MYKWTRTDATSLKRLKLIAFSTSHAWKWKLEHEKMWLWASDPQPPCFHPGEISVHGKYKTAPLP